MWEVVSSHDCVLLSEQLLFVCALSQKSARMDCIIVFCEISYDELF